VKAEHAGCRGLAAGAAPARKPAGRLVLRLAREQQTRRRPPNPPITGVRRRTEHVVVALRAPQRAVKRRVDLDRLVAPEAVDDDHVTIVALLTSVSVGEGSRARRGSGWRPARCLRVGLCPFGIPERRQWGT